LHHNGLGQPIGEPVVGWTPPPRPSRGVPLSSTSAAAPMVGRYCRIEPLDVDRHARDLFDANGRDTDDRMWTYLPYGPFASFDDYAGWVREAAASDDPLFYAVLDPATERAIGVASYLRIDPRAGSIEVGHIAYSPLLQHTAAGTEAMYLMMRYAFELGYRRYEWKCDALNAPSRAAAERLGFSFEGMFRQALVYKDRNRDTAWFAIIDADWPRLDRAFRQWLDPANFDGSGRQRVTLSRLTEAQRHRDTEIQRQIDTHRS
jgi:RimJ/RimL family protein N-acetyltransferase